MRAAGGAGASSGKAGRAGVPTVGVESEVDFEERTVPDLNPACPR
ncbi:hypothetical protein KCH_65430 [Kitasatospora cheerisanensis KCTC 2395]|uniref:Uncharacterized protein n=1 Tax=Kitasatospora cheerisanensis KCTC 2395 TaxID=1348663 RepID=A0A066YK23_9ACTN|nr:hypothetical protein KCH_65430 [Kitasatospora cheerisanensis KCTC 2395]